jgi:methylisocitrate lyase
MKEPQFDIPAVRRARVTWKEVLDQPGPVVLPAAHDALTARLIQRAGFKAYQVGGFALAAARFARPDVDLEHFGEKSEGVRDVIDACPLPVLVDADNGYGDAKNVTRTFRGYESLGASAVFLEDQASPKKCGHMADKKVIPREMMIAKIKAAIAARLDRNTFILARTDALQPEGVENAIARAEAYLEAGADGAYVEGPRTPEELEKVGKALRGAPLAVSILERGGVTPWMPPKDFHDLGFKMLLYPTSVIFRAAWAIDAALKSLRDGKPLSPNASYDMPEFETILELEKWAQIEKAFPVEVGA